MLTFGMALAGTVKLLGAGLVLGLPLGLLLGVPAGLRPGSRLDRWFSAVALLLAWMPVHLTYLALVYLVVFPWSGLVGLPVLGYLAIAPAFAGWLAGAVRDGLAESGSVRPGVLGRLGQRFGSLLTLSLVTDFVAQPAGLGRLLVNGVLMARWELVTGVLALVTCTVVLLRWAGSRAVAPPTEGARAPVGWLVAGGLLAVVLVGFALASFESHVTMRLGAQLAEPGPGAPLGTDGYGRDNLARISAGVRTSLGISLGAAVVALGGGAALRALRRAEREAVPDLYFPFLGALVGSLVSAGKPWAMLLGMGVCLAPSLAIPFRRIGGRFVLAVAAALMAGAFVDLIGLGLRPPAASLGTTAEAVLVGLRSMAYLLPVHLLLGLAVAGLALVGKALVPK